MDIKIDNNQDMLIENGDLVFVKDGNAISQHIGMRLRCWLGESPYDTKAGVPYLTVIFQPGTTPSAIIFILEQVILQTPGVTGVKLNYTLDRENRELTVTGTAESIDGPIDFTEVIS